VLRHQTTTLLVAFGTLAFTIFLFVVIPKGFFPFRNGAIQGVSEAAQTVSFAKWPYGSRNGEGDSQDPAVESLRLSLESMVSILRLTATHSDQLEAARRRSAGD